MAVGSGMPASNWANTRSSVAIRTRGKIEGESRRGLEDMDQENREQASFSDVNQRIADQFVRVLIERVRSQQEEQITTEVGHQEQEQRQPGERDEKLGTYR